MMASDIATKLRPKKYAPLRPNTALIGATRRLAVSAAPYSTRGTVAIEVRDMCSVSRR
eukprot:SAG11_NODE_174_length_13505_cov_9.126585_4_plen_58_part_00